MPRGDKSKYNDKQIRKANHIAEGYETYGIREDAAEQRAWSTVNKESGSGNKIGSGRGKPDNHAPARRGGTLGGFASAARSPGQRSASAKKASVTRKSNAGGHAE